MAAIGFVSPPAVKLTALASFPLLASFGWCWRIAPLSTFPSLAFKAKLYKNKLFFVVYLFEKRDLGKADMKFALTVFCPLKELALSCIRIADWLLAQISHKQWAELGKAGGQRYWKQSELQHPQEGLMKTGLVSPNSKQSCLIHPVELISFRIP